MTLLNCREQRSNTSWQQISGCLKLDIGMGLTGMGLKGTFWDDDMFYILRFGTYIRIYIFNS